MSLHQFLKSLSPKTESKTLTAKEEFKLGTTIQNSKTSAKARQKAIDTLVIKNVYLVLKMAPKYSRKEFEFDDIVGYGIVGLFTAAKKYDPERQLRFATYARHWIKESIMKAVREYSGSPKIPVNVRAISDTPWIKAVFRSHFVTCGIVEEDGELWDENGKLLVVSRQIAQFRKK